MDIFYLYTIKRSNRGIDERIDNVIDKMIAKYVIKAHELIILRFEKSKYRVVKVEK